MSRLSLFSLDEVACLEFRMDADDSVYARRETNMNLFFNESHVATKCVKHLHLHHLMSVFCLHAFRGVSHIPQLLMCNGI
jgi:hypothetical protein